MYKLGKTLSIRARHGISHITFCQNLFVNLFAKRQYDSTKPFFLFISHIEPHHQNDRNDYEGPNGSKEKYADFIPPADLEPGKGDWEQFYPDYLGSCNALDRNFGQVIEALKRKSLYKDTLIVYTSDHGCHFRTHSNEVVQGGYDDYKRNSFESSIHVPLLIKGRGFTGGRREDKLVSVIDLPITLLSAAGCEIEPQIQGRNLHLINDDDWENAVYIQISESFVGRAVRTDRYKYVVYAPDKNPWTQSGSSVYYEKYLFDMSTDPLEKNNLINDLSYSKIKAGLRKRLISFAKDACEGEITIELFS